MSENAKVGQEIVLENVIAKAVQIPGVRVSRKKCLAEIFATENIALQEIFDLGPIQAGVSQQQLARLAKKLIIKRTTQSSAASFVAGIPGGLALAATIPADILQFFGMALRLAQELSYLYGADDLWIDGTLDSERVKNQLILYCGVMFGVSSAVSGVRVLSAQVAKTALKKIPQKALTKTFWYPIIKQIGKAVGVKVTKSTVAKGASKVVPVLGGVISGGLNFASMLPMANRLQSALDSASFNYTDEQFEEDIRIIGMIDDEEGIVEKTTSVTANEEETPKGTDDVFETIKKFAELRDMGIITQEEFDAKKKELLGL